MMNLYDVLGVKSTASPEALKAAYYKIAKEQHPDRNGGEESQIFVDATIAYRVLSDDASRKDYDATGTYEEFDPFERQISTQLIFHFEIALQNIASPEDDVLALLDSAIKKSIEAEDSAIEDLYADLAVKLRVREKLRIKKDGAKNFLGMLLDDQIARANENVEIRKSEIAALTAARQRLENYEYMSALRLPGMKRNPADIGGDDSRTFLDFFK